MNHYLKRISSKRNVYFNGKKTEDVTKVPQFKGAINCIEKFYELQNQEQEKFAFIYEKNSPHISLMIPRCTEDLIKKRQAYKAVADLSYGTIGRTPDFANTIVMALATNNMIFGRNEYANFSENCINYYHYCIQNNLFICHGAINPQIDRSKQLGELKNLYGAVRCIRKNSEGIWVQGAKMIVTLAPIADEMLVFNMPGLMPEDEAYALAFAVPMHSEGIKIICRKSLVQDNYTTFDHPIANRFDEIDAYVIFNEVFIPWNKVFVFEDVKKSNMFFDKSYARNHSGHQDIVRGLSKFEFVLSVALKLAQVLGLANFPNIQESLGELLSFIELVKAGILLSEQAAEVNAEGIIIPDFFAIQAVRYNFPKMYQKAIQCIQSFGASSMLSVPHSFDFVQHATLLEQTLQTDVLSAKERACLLNLAWDISGDGFGQRQLLYENYHAGDPRRLAIQFYQNYDINLLMKKINEIISV